MTNFYTNYKTAEMNEAATEVETGADVTMKVGRWTRYVAGQEARAGGEFTASLVDHGTEWAPFAREVFARGFALDGDAPIDVEGEELHTSRQWIAEAHKAIAENEELVAALDAAKGDAWKSGMIVRKVVDTASRVVQPPKESSEEIEKQIEALKEMIGDDANSESNRTIRALHAKKRKVAKVEKEMAEAFGHESALVRRGFTDGAREALEEIEEIESALEAFGMGAGDGEARNLRIGGDRSALVDAFRRSEDFRRIARLAGRMRSRALQKQRDRAPDGRVELSSTKRGGDPARLVPSEIACLADADREAGLVRRLNEKSAEVYDLLGKEQRGDGPIIMLLDESSSMDGTPNEYVKAAAIAMLSVAALQRRAIAFVPFSDRAGEPLIIEDAEDANPGQLVRFVESFMHGGTNFRSPLNAALELLTDSPTFKRADVVMVTDGEAYDRFESEVDAIKRKGAHVYALLVGGEASGRLAQVADESMRVQNTTGDGAFDGMFSL